MPQPLWTIVLAAGAGRRLASVTDGVPKQFWHYDGRRSLLEATLDRVAPLSPPGQTVIVVDESHRGFLKGLQNTARYNHVMFQPVDRGTGVGVLLGLLHVLESAPEAIVLLTPSDHAVTDSHRFQAGIRQAVAHVRTGKDDVVLFGAQPTTPDLEYGWISASPRTRHRRFRRITRFSEKPTADRVAALRRSGAVWSTMVLVGTATALFDLYWKHLPQLASVFARALHLPAGARERFLDDAYRTLPTVDFSHHVIAPATDLSLFVWPAAMGWSDLGTPPRLTRWMEENEPASPVLARQPLTV
jgi:mannose-1-phosphate guanylyltransferase